jgi:hypothetical protein
MEPRDARRLLGVDESADVEQVRAAYRGLLLRTHPDVSGAADATARTIDLTRAFRVLSDPTPSSVSPSAGPSGPPPPASPEQTAPAPEHHPDPVTVELVDDDTIALGAPAGEALLLLLDAAHELGEISYLDPSAGLVEVVVEFVEAPTSSVLLSMQGRATGVTEVFCTVEPLSGGDAPPSDAVTRLLWRTLVERTSTPV